MWQCRMADRMIRFLPVKAWQDYLIRRHVSECSACMGKLAAKEEIRAVMIQEQDLVEVKDFWPEVKQRMQMSSKTLPRFQHPAWQWVSAGAALIVVVLVGFWLVRGFGGGERTAMSGQKLQIDYVKIEDKPAQTYVYKPQGADMTLVWVEKIGESE